MQRNMIRARYLWVWPLFLLLSAQAAFAVDLNVPQCYQEESNWCWAASSQAVLKYYGKIKTQTEIAQYGTQGLNIENWLSGSSTNPTKNGVDLILRYFANLSTTYYARFLNLQEVWEQINKKSRPIIITWTWDSGGGHILVIKGVDTSLEFYYLMDPFNGPSLNAYFWVEQGGGHTWTDSLTTAASPGIPPGVFRLLLF